MQDLQGIRISDMPRARSENSLSSTLRMPAQEGAAHTPAARRCFLARRGPWRLAQAGRKEERREKGVLTGGGGGERGARHPTVEDLSGGGEEKRRWRCWFERGGGGGKTEGGEPGTGATYRPRRGAEAAKLAE